MTTWTTVATTPEDRADLAEAMVPKACEFACLVHDGDRDPADIQREPVAEENDHHQRKDDPDRDAARVAKDLPGLLQGQGRDAPPAHGAVPFAAGQEERQADGDGLAGPQLLQHLERSQAGDGARRQLLARTSHNAHFAFR